MHFNCFKRVISIYYLYNIIILLTLYSTFIKINIVLTMIFLESFLMFLAVYTLIEF